MSTKEHILSSIRSRLMGATRLSGQSSYGRRAPAPESVPEFMRIGGELREFVGRNPERAEAWRLLSQVEECLLRYRQAIDCLERAVACSQADRHDHKRLALLREALAEWDELGLTPAQLQDLGQYLEQCGAEEEAHGRTLDHTRKWIELRGHSDEQRIIEALANRGGYTDFTILHNVVWG